MTHKLINIFITAALAAAAGLYAQTAPAVASVGDVTVGDVSLTREGSYLVVRMRLDMARLDVASNRAVSLTPRLAEGRDTLCLPAIGVYGRRRYYYYVRGGEGMLTGEAETTYRATEHPDTIAYEQIVAYEDWMDGARLSLVGREWGCCGRMIDQTVASLGQYFEAFFPTLVYLQPPAGSHEKTRAISGQAFVDFPLDRTEIRPDYRNNTAELGKIAASIDSVRGDRDVTITEVRLKGYASPEGSYAHNEQLAVGRTAALKHYIGQLYHFDDHLVVTDHEAEDWAGLRRYVERSNLAHRQPILDIIDSGGDPDERERRLRRAYPEEYRFLRQHCYPALRHTDYRIAYVVRTYTDVAEIKRVMRERPQNLSLGEFYIAAQTYAPGSDEFTEVFETAVRMYPADATANLNAANAAMRRGDLDGAARYLAKAGDSPEALYARGALAIRQGDIAAARTWLVRARARGVAQAAVTLDELDRGRR